MTIHTHIYNKVYSVGIVMMLLAAILFFSACGSSDKVPVKAEKVVDSLLVKVAVFPTLDALPLALANDWGVFDSLGVSVEMDVFRSQMDAEKALVDGKADVVLTDMFRVGWWQWHKKPLKFAFATHRPLYLVPNRALRVSKVEQLDDRMIAGTRNSIEDFFIDKIITQIKNRKGQILRPQINSVELRLRMLKSGQLDAVVLNAQQALKAQSADYPSLKVRHDSLTGLAGFAFNTNSLRTKEAQLSKLSRAYDIVVAKLRSNAKMPQISDQTRQSLFLGHAIDTLLNPKLHFAATSAPDDKNKTLVAEWLRLNAATSGYTGDTLFVQP